MPIATMADLNLQDKRVLVRQDLNVPIKNGAVSSDARIRASIPTIQHALQQGARVMVMSHLGRPEEGAGAATNADFSLAPVAKRLGELLERDVPLKTDWLNGVDVASGDIVLLENVRFNAGEKKNDDQLAKKMASLCDVFVMDAFGTAHRAQASTHGVAKFAAEACAGPLLSAELDALGRALHNPAHPLLAIVGGSKVSTKLTVLDQLADKVDQLIVGGGIANTFLAAAGLPIGKSLCEADLLPQATALMRKTHIPLPVDVVVGDKFDAAAQATVKLVAEVSEHDMIFDIGPQTAQQFSEIIAVAKTIIWNGPVGVFEFDQFGAGTQVLSQAIADSAAFAIAGGGDTLAAIDKYGISEQISYISTGGGAFLEFVEGKTLPAVAMLESRYQS